MPRIVDVLPFCFGFLALSAAAESSLPPPGLPPLQAYQAPIFPAQLAARSVMDGFVLVAVTLDGEGRVEDAFALDSSHEAFADAALEALGHWQFKPVKGASTPRRELMRFAFSRQGTVTSLSQLDAARNQFPSASQTLRTLSWNQLREPPQRIIGSRPEVQASDRSGSAVVSFVIDTQGRVRVPAIQKTTDKVFAASVLAAVKQWRYAPPLHDGDPVAVTVAQSFRYGSADSP